MLSPWISHLLDCVGVPIAIEVEISSSLSLTSVSVSSSSLLMSAQIVGITKEGFTCFSSPYLLDNHLTSLENIILFVFGFTNRYTFPACLSAYPTNIAFKPLPLNDFMIFKVVVGDIQKSRLHLPETNQRPCDAMHSSLFRHKVLQLSMQRFVPSYVAALFHCQIFISCLSHHFALSNLLSSMTPINFWGHTLVA